MGAKVSCVIYNDTKYHVKIDNYFGDQELEPGEKQGIWLYETGNYYVNLIVTFPHGNESVTLYNSEYKNRTHRISEYFRDKIDKYKAEERREAEERRKAKEKKKEEEKRQRAKKLAQRKALYQELEQARQAEKRRLLIEAKERRLSEEAEQKERAEQKRRARAEQLRRREEAKQQRLREEAELQERNRKEAIAKKLTGKN